ncbi:unnamed protein product [Allacma fusca]|uniref:Thyroid transcription factor 1-associated protein 26 n=1 Tax=Allacma fusca TaxID=39272 RepID=A0A8J2NPG8_9HEXA|nr:unnamed protein product [Allacma fusca]
MKKRNTTKYEGASYKAKKIEEVKERQFKRELGIKAGYKKLLRKQNAQLENNQTKSSNSSNQTPEQTESKNRVSSGWSVTPTSPTGERTLRTSGWNVTPSSSDTKPVKPIPKGWTPTTVAEGKPGAKKFNNWNISTDKSVNVDDTQEPNVKSWQGSNRSTSRNSEWRDKKMGGIGGKAKGPGGLGGKPSSLKKAQSVFARKEQERAEKAAMYEKRQKERETALKNRKQKRLEKFKVLSQKTPKGQPVMKGRMQLLLQKIQSSL